jgi:hypothetical protein
MTDLDARLRAADPANLTLDATHAAQDLAGQVGGLAPAARRFGRVRRPVLVGAVVGGLALSGGAAFAAPALIDLFSSSSPIAVTVPLGDAGSCSLFVNVVPADGATHTDKTGLKITKGSAATFDQREFDATAAFVKSHDWSSVVAGTHPFADVHATTKDGTTSGSGVFDTDQITHAVQAELTQNGLDAGGSAAIVTTGMCGTGTGR